MTPSEAAAVADRVCAVPPAPVPQVSYLPPVTLHTEVAAISLAQHIDAGDMSAVRAAVHQMEHRLGAWVDVNPWRLAEQVADLVIRRSGQPEPPAE
jgi:hypothetical protein